MAMRAYKCIVELVINEVSAPGVRLANKDDLYLNICLLGQQRRTRLVPPQFPLKFTDHLIFEKTFKFCHDPYDVVNFLNDVHVLVELIQLGRGDNNEALAFFESNAKDFLYPTESINQLNYISGQRDLFMARSAQFPGSISPQFIFSTSTRIDETQTPSLDILKEYENRFVNDPLIDISKKNKKKSKRNRQVNFTTSSKRGILRNNYDVNVPNENYANHTISSAIKADYTLPDVKFKLDELNSSVKKIKVVKPTPSIAKKQASRPTSSKPFVVRKVEDQLLLRKPELHDVLHDGLVLTEKSPVRIRYSKGGKRTKFRRGSLSQSSRSSRSNSAERPRSHSLNRLQRDYDDVAEMCDNTHRRYNSPRPRSSYSSRIYDDHQSRSLSLNRSDISLNRNLAYENHRPRSRGNSADSTGNRTYDILPGLNNSFGSNCEVCTEHGSRNSNLPTHAKLKKYQKIESQDYYNKFENPRAIFNTTNHKTRRNKSSLKKTIDPLNETTLFNTDDLEHLAARNNLRHGTIKEPKGVRISESAKKGSKRYPKNQSFAHYAPPSDKEEWKYGRYYPWLFDYTEYLRELEDELHWLKLRSHKVNHS